MKSLALALVLAAPAAAAVEKVVLPVSPLVVGSLAQPGHPLIPRLATNAGLVLNTPWEPQMGKNHPATLSLLSQTDVSAPLAERITGYALARIMVEPGLLDHATSLQPALQGSPIQALPGVMYANTGYRGGIAGNLRAIHGLADDARRIEAVNALFDGSLPQATLEDSGVTGRALYVGGQKTNFLGWFHAGRIFSHPTERGAVVEVHDEALTADDRNHELPSEGERLRNALARTGHAPRELGRDVVFSRGFGKAPMRKVVIREQVYGKNLSSAAMDGEYTSEDRKLVRDALLAYVAAGGALHDLKPAAIVLGTTILRPEKRAYLMDATLLNAGPTPEVLGGVDAWLKKFDFDVTVWKARAQRGFGSFRF